MQITLYVTPFCCRFTDTAAAAVVVVATIIAIAPIVDAAYNAHIEQIVPLSLLQVIYTVRTSVIAESFGLIIVYYVLLLPNILPSITSVRARGTANSWAVTLGADQKKQGSQINTLHHLSSPRASPYSRIQLCFSRRCPPVKVTV